ncbi:MAG: molybdopterin-dependent oxidoreductase [Desulfobacterota bacterium]|nr:molybdopterin-dependent oxidoreductase [Thermodesulfobacteriota bacterium]MDW8001881.1 molybdopterin-dependent oxidoreductase [Deltaproteobacteria bacterium]
MRYAQREIKSTCGLCQIGCGIIVKVSDSKVVEVRGDPDHPLNRGKLCIKGLTSIDYLYHPERITIPLRKEGKLWKKISWDEAIGEIAEKLLEIKAQYGPESIVFMRGSAKGLHDDYLSRFANAFGSPNITSMAHVCFIPRRMASTLTYGFYAICDLEYPPKCIVVWANNVSETLHHVYERIKDAKKSGAFLIVIDPIKTEIAKIADLWVKIRPGSDLLLALGLIYVIVKEEIYDRDFVEKYTIGFGELKNTLDPFKPEVVEKLTDVPKDLILKIAKAYAGLKPSVIQWGNGIDHTTQNFQTARAICILRAISGNLNIPGGDIYYKAPSIIERGSSELTLHNLLSLEERKRRIGGKGYMLPNLYYALPQLVIEAILKEDPYPIKGLFIQGGNFLLTYPNAKKVYEALRKVELLVVSDHFMTPTASLAHYFLPSATFFEFDSLSLPPYSLPVLSAQKKVVNVGLAKSDYEILRALSIPCGFGDLFWKTEKECLDYILSPLGIRFDDLCEIGYVKGEPKPNHHIQNGFPTPSGKVEIYSKRLEEWGFPPLPSVDLEKVLCEDKDPQYPLILTSLKRTYFRHSGGKNIEALRKKYPEPCVEIHPDVAESFGLKEGSYVYIETRQGRILQKVKINPDIHENTVLCDYGWYFPEEKEETLFGWDRSNINILTDDSPPFGREFGTPNLRAIPCRIVRLDPQEG